MKIFKLTIIILSLTYLLSGCGGYKKVDQRQMPDGASAKARKNVEEGRGTSIGSLIKRRGGGSFEFSSANPLWRASLETLDFLPMTTVDYSGGMIITDWYSDESNQNKFIKITIRFVSNEIDANSLKIIIHERVCSTRQNCTVNLLTKSKIREELNSVILRKAALFEKTKKK